MFSFKKWNLFLAVLHLEVAGTENNFSWSRMISLLQIVFQFSMQAAFLKGSW